MFPSPNGPKAIKASVVDEVEPVVKNKGSFHLGSISLTPQILREVELSASRSFFQLRCEDVGDGGNKKG